MIRFSLWIIFLALSFQSFAQPADRKAFENAIDPILSGQFNAATPGIAVLIARKGEIVYENVFGSANLELNVPIKPTMVFKLASITKQFTAVAILQLVQNGKILLADSLQKYITTFPGKGYTITIENLLTHTSGIKDLMQIDYGKPFMERADYDPNELINLFKDFPLDFPPGTKYQYSNSGYVLLGAIRGLQRIMGTDGCSILKMVYGPSNTMVE